MSNPFLLPDPSILSFSGGRTSAVMLRGVLDAHGGKLPPYIVPVFCNTGKERPETLDFVERVSLEWDVPIVWLEYRRWLDYPGHSETRWAYKPRKGKPRSGFEVVNYATASRNGEPFRAVIELKGILPNVAVRYCTQWLKIKTSWRYARFMLGWLKYTNAIGLRADEPKRLAKQRPDPKSTSGETPTSPLARAGICRDDVMDFWQEKRCGMDLESWLALPPRERPGWDLALRPHEGNCDLCLAGETEVVTSAGIRQIRDLAGTTPELLIPKDANGTPSEVGAFVACPVRSFGVQRLWRVDLAGHGRSTKTVYATAEHRWFLVPRKPGRILPKPVRSTTELKPGDRLRNLFRCPIGENRGGASQIGAMRGFVFGDGTVRWGQRPGTLQVHAGKDEVFLPMFAACCGQPNELTNANNGRLWEFYGIPNYWKKEVPDLKESRQYLMGWLSGYFAADGCVAEDGACVLSSANRNNLQFVRSLCAVLGIQCCPIRSQRRLVKPPGGEERMHEIYGVKINRTHLTSDFFWLVHHKQRVLANADKEERRYGWTVQAIIPTDRVEEVFCATVEGVGAFGLADGLMTGNCFLKGQGKLLNILQNKPDLGDWWIKQEQEFKGKTRLEEASRFRKAAPSYQATLEMSQQPTLFEMRGVSLDCDLDECRCTD